MSELPRSGAGHDDATRKKIHAAVAARNLASASNNTKWDELINHFRQLQGWRPSYRSKSVTGYVSEWDVEWFDIGLSQAVPSKGRLLAGTTIDHANEISKVVAHIGFEFDVRADVLRSWGYVPKSYEDFPPA
ncbi:MULTISPECIES: DUF6678 family protein [Pseudomonas]|jgi:hypothetical protein|uniref:DUF6678 family protein n=1 Tax=Pseudomonas TaxID=286 RepID=UPI000984840A|nr:MULTISPECIES: DUF6678 family protein [Pseudomonas]